MAATDAVQGAWEAQGTTVDQVERQLARILRELSQEAAPADSARGHLVPRAIVLNLIVHADQAGEAERAAQAMAALAARHPSRTLLLEAEPDAAADGLDAAISTHCATWTAVGGHLCFEQVRLTARGSTALHLASVAEPLLVADLPVILWWLGRPPARSEPLLELGDRLVVDSAYFPDAPSGLAALDAYTDQGTRDLELGDLSWRRHVPWRGLIAEQFDPPDARAWLGRIEHVTVEYAPTGGAVSAAPLLLLGWLAGRLGWQVVNCSSSGGGLAATFTTDEDAPDTITARLRARATAGVEAGELLSITLHGGEGDAAATFAVQRDPARGVLESRVCLPAGREHTRTVALAQPSRAELLARELELPAADPLYVESLAVVARLVR